MSNPSNGDLSIDLTSVSLLEEVKDRGKPWEDLAPKYGVTNPDPPWKVSLEATCDLLAGESCVKLHEELEAGSCTLPALERRNEEDEMAETLYEDVPYPERQLLALAHSMIKRGLLDESELESRMKEIGERLRNA